jgi:hypothetical protein
MQEPSPLTSHDRRNVSLYRLNPPLLTLALLLLLLLLSAMVALAFYSRTQHAFFLFRELQRRLRQWWRWSGVRDT